jgi:hypothetical protein
MSDGIGEWYKLQRQEELKAMTEAEREQYLAPLPRHPERLSTRETPVSSFSTKPDYEGIIYGEPPFWRQAINSINRLLKSKRKMLQAVLYCTSFFWLGYWVGAQ